jgi:ribonuclease D
MSRRVPAPDTVPALVTTSAELETLCRRLSSEEFVTVDTEFMRERTYWPELCVVQLGGEDEVAVVDALAPDLDLAPLGALLADPSVVKVFHAARQDVEIFLLRFGAVPTPMFDTQIAAMVAGFGDQVSYDGLCRALAGVSIEKAHRFSDWSARPLSASQIDYAAADVTHLRRVYTGLRERLSREGRLDWVAEEMAALTDPAGYRVDPETAWERLKPRTQNRRALGVLRAAAAWREREAQRVNIPRQRLVRDETLLELSATGPHHPGGAGAGPRRVGRLRPRPQRRRAAGRHRNRQGAAGLAAAGTAARPPRPLPLSRLGGVAEGAARRQERGARRRAPPARQRRGAGPPGHGGCAGGAGVARLAAGGLRRSRAGPQAGTAGARRGRA